MTPNAITTGDCVKLMRKFKARSIDHVITDPPYSERVHSKSRRGITNYKEKKGDAAREAREARVRDLGFESITPKVMRASAKQFARIARRWVMVFCDIELIDTWRKELERNGLEYVRTLFWHKKGATPQQTGDRPANHVEAIVLCHQTHPNGEPTKKRWNNGGNGNVYRFAIVLNRSQKDPRWHTTQKPLALMSKLVADFTDEGETVFDGFAGSGTTLLALRAANRIGYGCELDPEVAATGNRRIETTRDQFVLPAVEKPAPHTQEGWDMPDPETCPQGPRETT